MAENKEKFTENELVELGVKLPNHVLEKQKELSLKHGLIHVLYCKKDKESVIYLKEPTRAQKIACIEKAFFISGEKMKAAELLIQHCAIKEESDIDVIVNESASNDKYYIGHCLEALKIIEYYDSVLKKN